MKRTVKKIFVLLLTLAVLCTLLPTMALAKTEGTIEAETVNAYVLNKDGVNKTLLYTWMADAEADTYRDADGVEMPGVTNASFANYGDGTTQNYILYTGSDNGCFARAITVAKYITLNDLMTTLAVAAGISDDSASSLEMKTGTDGWATTYGPGTTTSGLVSSEQTLYASFAWLEACRVNGNSARNLTAFSANNYTDSTTVPAVLAIRSYNNRINIYNGVTDADTLKAAITAQAAGCDMANALRFVSGMDEATTNGRYLNTGANSSKGVSDLILKPVYRAITVTDGTATGTEGAEGYRVAVTDAAVTSADNWFKAAKGETVTLTVVPTGDDAVTGVSVNNGDVAVTPGDNNTYVFTMPAEVATVVVTMGAPAADKWDGTLDFSWYNAADVKTEYHISTPAQWAALAWICSEHLGELNALGAGTFTNGNVTDIIGTVPTTQNTFAGVQFYLDADLDMGGVYDSANQTWSGPNYYPVGSQTKGDNGTGNFYGLFYGSFDGQGHIVKNIYCNRGDSQSYQSAGLFGRVGSADGQPTPNADITIKNVAVTGYICTGRSAGGIVGKTLHVATGKSIKVENCLNFADVMTINGAKGVGGVVGTLWNGASVNNCANFGSVTGSYTSANVGGVSGAAEGPTSNSYNVGTVINTSNAGNVGALALNQRTANVTNSYALTGSAPGYTTSILNGNTLVSGGWKSSAEMKAADFATLLGDGWVFIDETCVFVSEDVKTLLNGYPVPAAMLSAHGSSETITPAIGNDTAITIDGVTSFAAGTDSEAPTVSVTAPADGWVAGENTFTVASTGNVACVVLVKDSNGNYTKLTASGETHSFTATLSATDSIVVAVKGDANGDGLVQANDITMAKAQLLGKTTLTSLQNNVIDLDGNGSLGANEITSLKAAQLAKTTLTW